MFINSNLQVDVILQPENTINIFWLYFVQTNLQFFWEGEGFGEWGENTLEELTGG